jgi:hypothetical protein
MGATLQTWYEVAAPVATPYRYGLFSVAEPRSVVGADLAPDDHWRLGVEWVSEACSAVEVTTGPCINEEIPSLSFNRDCSLFQFDPFTVYAFNTDAGPGRTVAQHRANAIARLTNGEQRTVETVLWAQLATAVPAPTSLASFPAHVALGWVEQALAESYGSQGVIHMNRQAALTLGLYLHPEGSVLRTVLGTPVVVGGGYDPLVTPPANTATLFGTGPLVMYRGEIDAGMDAYNRAINDVSIVAQRDYVLGWDCSAVGAEISLGGVVA